MTTPAFVRERASPPPQRGGRWHVRAFGSEVTDLDIHFGSPPARELATSASASERLASQLLHACLRDGSGQPVADEDLDTWTLARRLQGLLQIRLIDEPAAALHLAAVCDACHAEFEFELELARCVQPQGIEHDPPPLAWTSPGGHSITVRLPCAADLQSWQAQGLRGSTHLATTLVAQVDGCSPEAGFVIPEAWAEPLAERLAEADPLTALSVAAACPDCGHQNDVAVDLVRLLLGGFALQQRQLLDDLACLARAFHWSEAQILALPAWRRARYLSRIESMDVA